MTSIYLFTFILVVSLFEMPEAKCLPRRPWTPSCNHDELNVLQTLKSALEETKNSKSQCKKNIDVKEIIMKLVNALVYTSVNNIKNRRCGKKSIIGSCKTEVIDGSDSNAISKGNKKTHTTQSDSDKGLINLDLLNPNDPDNVLKLDIDDQKVLGVGLGDTVSDSNKDTTKTDTTQNNSEKGLITLDLLNTNDPDNVLKLEIVNQKVLGVGLGDTVPGRSKDITKTDTTQNDSDKVLIDLDLLNPNDPDNVLNLDIADQKVLGVGLGDTVPDNSKDTTKTDTTQNDSDKGLIDLDLLNANDPDNVLKLDIADQKVLGVGLGNTVPDSSKDTTKTDTTQNDSDKGLIDLNLLNANDPDNVLKLDIADQKVLGIGLGDTVRDSSKETTKTDTTKNDSDKGFINLDLLNANDPDNLLKLDIADQKVLGIGLGDTILDSSKDTTKTDTTQNDSDKGLIDLDLLNPNDPDNVLKLDIADHKLLGVGLGDTVPDSSKDTTQTDTTQNDSDKGLINLDLLNPNDSDNVLKLDIADQKVLGIGLEDTTLESSKDTTKTDTTQNDSDEGFINLDLVNTNDPDNLLKLDIADQKVLGIGLGDTIHDSSKDTTKTDTTQNDSDKGLIDLDLLNPNDPDNVLKLDIADQKVLGVGLGDTVSDSSNDTTKTDTTQNDSDKGLIDLDLLNPNDPDNVLKLDIADHKLLGVGLGDTVPDSSKDTTQTDTTQNDSDKGLINLDLLNPNDSDNVLKLDIADQKVLGIGLGDTTLESSKDTTKTDTTQNDSDEGLIDLDLLNPNDPDNVLNLDVAEQNVLGIGLGDTSN